MPKNKKSQFTKLQPEPKEVHPPDPNSPDPKGIVTTKRPTKIDRSLGTSGMTTDSGRFQSK